MQKTERNHYWDLNTQDFFSIGHYKESIQGICMYVFLLHF